MKAKRILLVFLIAAALFSLPVLAYDDDDIVLHLDMDHIIKVTDTYYVVGADGEQIEIESSLDLLTDLVSYWDMDEISGTRYDAHGSNNLTDNNTVGYDTGIIDNAAAFVAANTEYLSHTDNEGLSLGSDQSFTWAGWFYLSDSTTTGQIIVDKSPVGGAETREYRVKVINGELKATVGNGTTSISLNSDALTTTTWYHFALVHDADQDMVRLHINNAVTSTAWTSGTQDTTSDVRLGYQLNNSSPLDGNLDQIGFWKRALNTTEIAALYNNGGGKSYTTFNESQILNTPYNVYDLSDQITDISANTTWSARLLYTPSYDSDADWPDEAVLWDTRGASDNARVTVEYEDSDDAYHVYINGADRLQSSAQSFTAGYAQDVIVTIDFNSDEFKLYVNGSLEDSETVILGAPTLTDWMLGSDYAGANHANATIVEYTIIDAILTESEVSDLYGESLTSIPTGGDVDLPAELIGYWQMEETSGTRADSWGDNDLTDNNTVGYADGIIDNAASFNRANNEYLSHANNADLDTGDVDFTTSAWVYMETLTSTGVMLRDVEYALWYDADLNRFAMTVNDPACTQLTVLYGNTPVVTDTWYFLAAWHDATDDELGIRINGNETIVPYDDGVCDSSTTGNVFKLGSSTFGTLDGRIDEAVFWKRTLTPAERSFLYHQRAYETLGNTGETAETDVFFLAIIGRNTGDPDTSQTPTPTPFPYPSPTPEDPFIGIDYSGDTSWTDWAAIIEDFFQPIFVNVDSAEEGLNTLRSDVCGQGFEGDAGFLPGNNYDDPIEAKIGIDETPTILEVAYSFGMALGRPFGWVRALYSWLPAIQNSYNVAGLNFFVMLIYATTAGIVWIAFVIIVTYSLYFIRTVIDLAIQIYELIPLKAT